MTLRATILLGVLALVGCGSSDAPAPAAPTDSGTSADTAETSPPATSCTSARDTALGPVDKVSSGAVTLLSEEASARTLYIDATAGGFSAARNNPYTYVSLATGERVDLTDPAAFDDKTWDLAFKRASIHTNSGDAGTGSGGAVFLPGKDFAVVTAADAAAAMLKSEDWFDDECQPYLDPTNTIETSFKGWYDYADSTMKVTPKAGVFVVRGATGELYKLQILDYYGTPTGGTGMTSANFIVKVAALK